MLNLDKAQIEQLVDYEELLEAIEEAYRIYRSGEYFMPERPFVEADNKTLMYMPCYTKDMIGTKILSIFPDNASLGLPSIDGVVLLNDVRTGRPLATLDGQSVTAWRTGAVGGVAMRYLSRPDAATVGIIGAGMQGFHQALFACQVRPIKTVCIYNHSRRDLSDYCERLRRVLAKPGVEVVQCRTAAELAQRSEIIVTTTPASSPVLPDDAAVLRGKCIVAIGSYTPQMREIPDAVWELVKQVYIELPYALAESGDLSQPLAAGRLRPEQTVLMSDYLAGPHTPPAPGETTYFKSVGMALFDICAARKIMQAAKER